MTPQRPSGSVASPAVPSRAASPSGSFPVQAAFEAVKKRVLAKLEERLDMGSSKRMPQSLLRQSLKQQAEQIADLEARGLGRADRDRLVEEVMSEMFGFGPLEELLGDPTVREVMVTAPNIVIVRKDAAQWMPTSVQFR
ncbi:MAG: hypothetical protein K2V38_13875, partial [Gemmataceae bacterium]|nr:hypothetical protein [Gemmataceae bacterium]